MAKTTSGQQGNEDSGPDKTEEAKPEVRVHLVLLTETDGIGSTRVVSASEARADKLLKARHARKATAQQVALAAGRIPHLAG